MKSKQLDAALAAGVMFALSLPHKLASIIAGNAARISVLAIYYGAIVGLSANNANAEFITQADFDSSAVVSDLNNLGPAPDVFATPFTLGIYTFTTDNGILGYYATQGLLQGSRHHRRGPRMDKNRNSAVGSNNEIRVQLPPGRARLATRLPPTGSMTFVNTIGTLRVAFCSALTVA
jgi:hypothetical protein